MDAPVISAFGPGILSEDVHLRAYGRPFGVGQRRSCRDRFRPATPLARVGFSTAPGSMTLRGRRPSPPGRRCRRSAGLESWKAASDGLAGRGRWRLGPAARFLVDATGRAAALLRSFGIGRIAAEARSRLVASSRRRRLARDERRGGRRGLVVRDAAPGRSSGSRLADRQRPLAEGRARLARNCWRRPATCGDRGAGRARRAARGLPRRYGRGGADRRRGLAGRGRRRGSFDPLSSQGLATAVLMGTRAGEAIAVRPRGGRSRRGSRPTPCSPPSTRTSAHTTRASNTVGPIPRSGGGDSRRPRSPGSLRPGHRSLGNGQDAIFVLVAVGVAATSAGKFLAQNCALAKRPRGRPRRPQAACPSFPRPGRALAASRPNFGSGGGREPASPAPRWRRPRTPRRRSCGSEASAAEPAIRSAGPAPGLGDQLGHGGAQHVAAQGVGHSVASWSASAASGAPIGPRHGWPGARSRAADGPSRNGRPATPWPARQIAAHTRWAALRADKQTVVALPPGVHSLLVDEDGIDDPAHLDPRRPCGSNMAPGKWGTSCAIRGRKSW